jgi:hypothetical protein
MLEEGPERIVKILTLWAVAVESGSCGRSEMGNPGVKERLPLEAANMQQQWRRDCAH